MLVYNSTNINKTKESLNSEFQHFHQYQLNRASLKQFWSPIWTKERKLNIDGQQFHQYQQNRESLKSAGNNSTNINKTKESLNSDGQHFHQYQQNREI